MGRPGVARGPPRKPGKKGFALGFVSVIVLAAINFCIDNGAFVGLQRSHPVRNEKRIVATAAELADVLEEALPEQVEENIEMRRKETVASGLTEDAAQKTADVLRIFEQTGMMAARVWEKLQEMSDPPKKMYVIPTWGSGSDLLAHRMGRNMLYFPHAEGEPLFHRLADKYTVMRSKGNLHDLKDKPELFEPEFKQPNLWITDRTVVEMCASQTPPTNPQALFEEDEDKWLEMHKTAVREFAKLEYFGVPQIIVLNEALPLEKDMQEIMKTGLILWFRVTPMSSWKCAISYQPMSWRRGYWPRPPVWYFAADMDVGDEDAMMDYVKVMAEREEVFRNISDVVFSLDDEEMYGKSMLQMKYIMQVLSAYLGISNATGVSTGTMEDLLKQEIVRFLDGARLPQYLDEACAWADEMGAVSLNEVAENAEELGKALQMKPLELKRLQKAADLQLSNTV